MNFSDVLGAANIDRETTLRRFSGNEALMERFLRRFPQDPTFAALEKSIQEQDWEEACHASHTLKGISGNLGLDELMSLNADLVSALREKQVSSAPVLYDRVAGEYARLIALLAQLD